MTDGLSPNMEHYLQAVYFLQKRHKVARVKDIADMMSVTMPSVTSAVKSLRDKNLVENTRYGYVELTPDGREIALQLIQRNALLREFLADVLHLNPNQAEFDACKIEHVISDEALQRLERLVQITKSCPLLKEPAGTNPTDMDVSVCQDCPVEHHDGELSWKQAA